MPLSQIIRTDQGLFKSSSPTFDDLTLSGKLTIGDPVIDSSELTYSDEALAFFARLATQPTRSRKIIYNRLIVGLKTVGIWDVLEALYIYATIDAPTALINLISSSYTCTPVNSPTFAVDGGYTGSLAGTKYLDTGFDPTVGTPKFVKNNLCIFAHKSTNLADDDGGLIGHNSTTYVYPYRPDGTFYGKASGGGTVTSNGADFLGLFAVDRNNSKTVTQYIQGVKVQTTDVASSDPESANIKVLINTNGAGSKSQVAAAGFGGSLTAAQHQTLSTLINNYLDDIVNEERPTQLEYSTDVSKDLVPRIPISTNTTTDEITFATDHGWMTGALVHVEKTEGGLTLSIDYYLRAISSTKIAFFTSSANAIANTSRVNLTANITGEVQTINLSRPNPGLAELTDGRFICVSPKSLESQLDASLVYYLSTDKGLTFSDEILIFTPSAGTSIFDTDVSVSDDGTVLIMATIGDNTPSPSAYSVNIWRGTHEPDGTITFSSKIVVLSSYWVSTSKPVQLLNGQIMQPVYHFDTDGYAAVVFSSDDGKTYGSPVIVTAEIDTNDNITEMDAVQFPDGEIVAIIRNNNDITTSLTGLWLVRSFDSGQTWTPRVQITGLTDTPLPWGRGLVLTQNGRLIVLSVFTSTVSTHGTAYIESSDRGKTWTTKVAYFEVPLSSGHWGYGVSLATSGFCDKSTGKVYYAIGIGSFDHTRIILQSFYIKDAPINDTLTLNSNLTVDGNVNFSGQVKGLLKTENISANGPVDIFSSLGLVSTVSGAGTLTLSNASTVYIFTGTTTTWTLPALSANVRLTFLIKNRGSGSITLQRAGSDNLYDTTTRTSITIAAGASAIITNDGTYWCVLLNV